MNEQYLGVPIGNTISFFKLSDISAFVAQGAYTQILFSNKTEALSSKNLKKVSILIGANNFVRVHRSYIINLDHIESISKEDHEVHMKNGFVVPISRRHGNSFLGNLEKF